MPIPESQLDTWANQGATTGSATTYAAIKRALESDSAKYFSRDFDVFLQGSYGNSTNIYSESDVDVVICFHGAFYKDISGLSVEEQAAYEASKGGAGAYPYDSFKSHVMDVLTAAFGGDVKPGTKAIKILPNSSRRSADVIVAFDFRRYTRFRTQSDCDFREGISFFTSDNDRIDNFPKLHSENATAKHQATNGYFKPLVRIFKNMRGKLISIGVLDAGDAPSYFIEGLLYNIPNENFGESYSTTFYNILKWLGENTDRTKFVCVNERYYLLRDNNRVCWPAANGKKFIDATTKLWNNWTS